MTRVLKFRQDARPCGPWHGAPFFSHILKGKGSNKDVLIIESAGLRYEGHQG